MKNSGITIYLVWHFYPNAVLAAKVVEGSAHYAVSLRFSEILLIYMRIIKIKGKPYLKIVPAYIE